MKKYIFLIVFIAAILIAVIGGDNYCYGDNLHDIPILTRLCGMVCSLFILVCVLAIIGDAGREANG